MWSPRRHRHDEPDLRNVPSPGRWFDEGDADRLPRLDQGDRGTVHGRRRGTQDDERRVLRRWANHRPPPQGDVAAHAHRVHASRTQLPRSARHPARDHVRADRHRVTHAERVRRHPSPRARASRLLLRSRRPVHPERRRRPRPGRTDPHPYRVPPGPAPSRAGRCDARSALRPDGRGCPRRTARPPACWVPSERSTGTASPRHAAMRTLRARHVPSPDDPAIAELLSSRNARLAEFWLNPQGEEFTGPFAGHSALVVDAEDRFTTMLAHQLRHLGLAVTIAPWSEVRGRRSGCRRPRRRRPRSRRPAGCGERPHRQDARRGRASARFRRTAARGVPQPPDPRRSPGSASR